MISSLALFKNAVTKSSDIPSISLLPITNLVLRYSFNDNKNLATDTVGIQDVSSKATPTTSGSHSGFSGNFFSNVVDETKTHIPSIGALRRVTNKVRIESNPIKSGEVLQINKRATNSASHAHKEDVVLIPMLASILVTIIWETVLVCALLIRSQPFLLHFSSSK